MIDQANDLRALVTHSAATPRGTPSQRARIVLVAGGKGGVGTTTVAVNLATALALRDTRTVLVDADPDGPDVQTLCRTRQRYTISDVLAGRRTLGEALQPGPGGLMILPGAWAQADLADASDICQARLLDQLAGLGSRADLVVVDGGNGLHGVTRRLWQACDELVLVTTGEPSAVLDSYAALKIALDPERPRRVSLLVNRCGSEEQAVEVHGRISHSCRRFLGFGLPTYYWLPADAAVAEAERHGTPLVISNSTVCAAEAILAIAESVESKGDARSEAGSESFPKQQTRRNENNSHNRFNPNDGNVDSEEDRRLFVRC